MADSSSGGNNGWMAIAAQGLISGASAVTKGGPKRQYKYNKKLAEDQNKMNRENSEWILQQNQRLLDEQRSYDSPAAMMQRYKDAGLNPHLIYDKGANSSAPIQVGNIPGVNMGQVDASYPDVAQGFLQAGQTMANTGLLNQRIDESAMNTQAKAVQVEIAKTNPMLDPMVSNWVSQSMQEGARVAAQKAAFEIPRGVDEKDLYGTPYGRRYLAGVEKITKDIEKINSELGLNTQDAAIKNKILQSKEYENAVKKAQAEWMSDAELTPEHWRQALMMLLGKMTN